MADATLASRVRMTTMHIHTILRRLSFLALLATLACASCRAEVPPEERIQAEMKRLDGVLQRLESGPPGIRGAVGGLRAQLAKVRQASSPSVLVYQLREPMVKLEMLDFIAAHQGAGKDVAGFEAAWKGEQQRFAAAAHPVPKAPLLAGLAQTAENYGEKMYRASLPYAKASGPGDGLYYLAEAEGNLRLRDFVASLSLPAGGEALDHGALQAGLERLESEMLESFAADPGSPAMIPVSARLKEARELFERGSQEGAALTLLECRLALSRRRSPSVTGAGPAPAEKDAPEEGSLIAPFLAMAAADGPDGVTARIIRADVVPLYQSFLSRRNP